jgi:hypothetical protein
MCTAKKALMVAASPATASTASPRAAVTPNTSLLLQNWCMPSAPLSFSAVIPPLNRACVRNSAQLRQRVRMRGGDHSEQVLATRRRTSRPARDTSRSGGSATRPVGSARRGDLPPEGKGVEAGQELGPREERHGVGSVTSPGAKRRRGHPCGFHQPPSSGHASRDRIHNGTHPRRELVQ